MAHATGLGLCICTAQHASYLVVDATTAAAAAVVTVATTAAAAAAVVTMATTAAAAVADANRGEGQEPGGHWTNPIRRGVVPGALPLLHRLRLQKLAQELHGEHEAALRDVVAHACVASSTYDAQKRVRKESAIGTPSLATVTATATGMSTRKFGTVN